MPDTPTPKLGLLRPKLGKKPWKKEWDFNMGLLDNKVGGLIDGTVSAGNALSVQGAAIVSFLRETTGTVTGTFNDGTTTDVTVDHSATIIFDLSTQPVFTTIAGVAFILMANRPSTANIDEGGKFTVRIVNTSGGTVLGSSMNWRRKGLKLG